MLNHLFENRIKKLAIEITSNDHGDIEKIKSIHDYIILNTAYDLNVIEKLEKGEFVTNTAWEKEGVLNRGLAVCTGYSKAAVALLEAIGIKAIYVTNDDHAWNMVKVGGIWYHLDFTHDDPVPDVPGRVCYDHFLISSKTLAKFRKFVPEKPAPDDYFEHVKQWNGQRVVHSLEEIHEVVRDAGVSAQEIRMFAWKMDPSEAIHRVFSAMQKVGMSTSGWSGSYLGSEHFRDIKVSNQYPPGTPQIRGILRPWFRLWCGRESFTVVAKDVSSHQMNRNQVRTCFSQVKSPEGVTLDRFISRTVPALEFRWDAFRGWEVRVPKGAANAFLIRLPGQAEEILEASYKPLTFESQLSLYSTRARCGLDWARFQVEDKSFTG